MRVKDITMRHSKELQNLKEANSKEQVEHESRLQKQFEQRLSIERKQMTV